MISLALSFAVITSLIGLMINMMRSQKAILSQEMSLSKAKQAIELINREIRPATEGSIIVVDASGNPAPQGNRVEFARMEIKNNPKLLPASAIELTPGDDGDFSTTWDNQLLFYIKATDQPSKALKIITGGVGTPDTGGAFKYLGATEPLAVRLRTGDSVSTATTSSNKIRQDNYSGRNMQGVDINITVGPRNALPN